MTRLPAQGVAVLMVEQRARQALAISDRGCILDQGRVVLDVSMEELEVRYLELVAGPDQAATARSLDPIYERQAFGRTHLVYHGVARERLASLGEVRTASLADIFVAVVGGRQQERAA